MNGIGNQLLFTAKEVLVIFLALFPIVNPVGTAPLFLSLTEGYSLDDRRKLARSVAINGSVLLVVSMLIGSYILAFFGISVPVVQVGGGLVVTAAGWRLLNRPPESADESAPSKARPREDWRAIAFYPLTMPLTVGPGSISVALTLGANSSHEMIPDLVPLAAAIAGIGAIGLSIYFSYRSADRLERLLGETGTDILMRLTSFILVCIGIQIITNGVTQIVRHMVQTH